MCVPDDSRISRMVNEVARISKLSVMQEQSAVVAWVATELGLNEGDAWVCI